MTNKVWKFFTCGLCRGQNDPEVAQEQTFPSMKKNKDVKGTIKFDKTTNVDMWRKIIDNSIVGTNIATKVVACSKSSNFIIACHPIDYTPSIEQISFINSGFENPDIIKSNGFLLVTDTYDVIDVNENEIAARNKENNDEILLVGTNSAILICCSPNPIGHLRNELKDILEMIRGQGF